MWLVVSLACATVATAAFFLDKERRRHKLGFLTLMLWGTFVMVLVDHSIAFAENGGEFVEAVTDGLVPDAAILGALMAIPPVAAWAIAVRTDAGTKISRYL